jgi:predicted O-methyltransferase YrrM
MIDLAMLPGRDELASKFSAAAESEEIVRLVLDTYRTGIMLDDGQRKETLNESCIGQVEGMILWNLARQLRPELIIETGFGRGTSAAFFLSAMAPWNGKLISIDPAFRHWAGDIGSSYIKRLGGSGRHEIVERPSEVVLAMMLEQAPSRSLKLSYVDGSHHFDGALMDFVYLDRMTEVGGVIGIDDAHAPAMRTLASFIANNLPYRLHYATQRLVLCQKSATTDREWCHFRPFRSSPNADWQVHEERPDDATVPHATYGCA